MLRYVRIQSVEHAQFENDKQAIIDGCICRPDLN